MVRSKARAKPNRARAKAKPKAKPKPKLGSLALPVDYPGGFGFLVFHVGADCIILKSTHDETCALSYAEVRKLHSWLGRAKGQQDA